MLVAVRFESNLSATTDEGAPIVGTELETVLETFVDAITDEMDRLPGALGLSVGGSLVRGTIEIDFEVEAASSLEALASGLALLNVAFGTAAAKAGSDLRHAHIGVSEVASSALALV